MPPRPARPTASAGRGSNVLDNMNDLLGRWLCGSEMPFNLMVSAGRIPGATRLHKFGHNMAVGTSLVTVWPEGSIYSYLSSASVLKVSSSDANDTSAGSGAQTVQIYGLDTNYLEINEIVTLNGQAAVETQNSYLRVHRGVVRSAGATGANEGIIYAGTGNLSSGVPDNVYLHLDIALNQTLMTLYTVPAGKTLFIRRLHWTVGSGKELHASFVIRPFGEVFQTKLMVHLYQIPFDHLITFEVAEEKSDVEMRVKVDAGSTAVSAGFHGFLITN